MNFSLQYESSSHWALLSTERGSAHFGSTYTKIGMIQKRLAWPLCKDDMQIHEVFHIKKKEKKKKRKSCWKSLYCGCLPAGNIPVQTLVPWAISIHLALSLRVTIYQSCYMSTVCRQSNQVATVLDLITIFHWNAPECIWLGFPGFNQWVGKIPNWRKWQLTPVFSPREFHGQKSLVGYSLLGLKRVRQTLSQACIQKNKKFFLFSLKGLHSKPHSL